MTIGRIPSVEGGIQPTIVDAKGDLIVATAADTVNRLAVGTNEYRLVADSGETTGLKYVADTTNYAVAAKGDLLVGTAADTLSALSVGTDGYTLVADSGETTGLKWAAPAASGALTLVKEQTIGSAVASVTVTGAFSATYDNYLIIVSDGSGTAANTSLTLGSTTANYYMTGVYFSPTASTVTGFNINNGANWTGTYVTTSNNSGHINLQSPYLSKRTTFSSVLIGADSGSNFALYQGFLADTTSYTAFTLTPASGTLTGGKIRVYGYQNS